MPTGYTSKIESGQTFEDFVMHCSTAMLYDTSVVPEVFTVGKHHVNRLNEAIAHREELISLTPEKAEELAEEDYRNLLAYFDSAILERTSLKEKYDAMLTKVNAWVPPSPEHVQFHEYMKQQIQSSIKSDCSTDYFSPPEKLSGPEWLAQQIKRADSDIRYHAKELEKETIEAQQNTKWFGELRASLQK